MKEGLPISVIIPVFNGEKYLAEALRSVLAQTCRPLEVLVIDDGSTDGSAAVAAAFPPPVICHRQAHGGIGAARNRGVELARGAFLAFLDADDLWTEDKLEIQWRAFALDPRLDLVFGSVSQFISPDLEEELRGRLDCPPGLLPGAHPGALLARRDSFLRVGLFRTDCRVGEFIDWYARAAETGLRVRMLPEPVMRRRLHDANQGLRQGRSNTDYLRVLKAALDRRRAAAGEKGDRP